MSEKTKKDYKEIKDKMESPKVSQEEALENLKKQYVEYTQQAKLAQEMALKSQGAIEVLEALINQEEK